jgi:hypothetical protein
MLASISRLVWLRLLLAGLDYTGFQVVAAAPDSGARGLDSLFYISSVQVNIPFSIWIFQRLFNTLSSKMAYTSSPSHSVNPTFEPFADDLQLRENENAAE